MRINYPSHSSESLIRVGVQVVGLDDAMAKAAKLRRA
jgi:hypothetical protein